MFRRKKNTENTPQIGSSAEQLNEPTPVGDALEQEIRHTLYAGKLQEEIDKRNEEVDEDPEMTERLGVDAALARALARKASGAVLANLPRGDRRYWRGASKHPLPTRRK